VLARHDIDVVETPAVALVGSRGDLRGVRLVDDQVIHASMLFFSVDHRPRTDLAVALGAEIDAEGYVRVDVDGQTSVSGVYAAGDLTAGMQLVQVAAAKGVVAGVSAALSLHGEPGSPLSPPAAPDAPGELDEARP
jgi:thioredoxin reductase